MATVGQVHIAPVMQTQAIPCNFGNFTEGFFELTQRNDNNVTGIALALNTLTVKSFK